MHNPYYFVATSLNNVIQKPLKINILLPTGDLYVEIKIIKGVHFPFNTLVNDGNQKTSLTHTLHHENEFSPQNGVTKAGENNINHPLHAYSLHVFVAFF